MPTNHPYVKGTIAEIDSVRSLTGLPAEHFEDCGCCDLGYVDRGPVWFICPYHTGYAAAWKTIEILQRYSI